MRLILISFLFFGLNTFAQAPQQSIFDNDSLSFPYSIELASDDGEIVFVKRFDCHGNVSVLDNNLRLYKAKFSGKDTFQFISHSLKQREDSFYQDFYSNGIIRSHFYLQNTLLGFDSYFTNGKARSRLKEGRMFCSYEEFYKNGKLKYKSLYRDSLEEIECHLYTDTGLTEFFTKILYEKDTIYYEKRHLGEVRKMYDVLNNKRTYCIGDTSFRISPGDSAVIIGRNIEDHYYEDGTHSHLSQFPTASENHVYNYEENDKRGVYKYHYQYFNSIIGIKSLRYEWFMNLDKEAAFVEKRYHDFTRSPSLLQYEVRMNKDSLVLYTYNSEYYNQSQLKKEIIWDINTGYERHKEKRPKRSLFGNRRIKIQEVYPNSLGHLSTDVEYKVLPLSALGSDSANYRLVGAYIKNKKLEYSDDDFVPELFSFGSQNMSGDLDDFVELFKELIERKSEELQIKCPKTLVVYLNAHQVGANRLIVTENDQSQSVYFKNEVQKWLGHMTWTYGANAELRYKTAEGEFSSKFSWDKPDVKLVFMNFP